MVNVYLSLSEKRKREISPDRKIVQALAADNQELNETQQQFLEAFARDRHISLQNQTAGFPV